MKVSRLPLRLERLEDRSVPATFSVTSLDDTNSSGTLRWAINQANLNSQDDTIFFAVSGTLELTSALPAILGSVQIQGLGVGQTVISVASSVTNGFTMFSVDGIGNVLDLRNVTLADGLETNFSGATGIKVSNGATLVLVDAVVRDHRTDYWGVIQIIDASATISNTLFQGHTHGNVQQRGVIHNWQGSLYIISSTFRDNDMGVGGAIMTESTPTNNATTTIRNVTFSDTASSNGAIILLESGSNFSGNTRVDLEYSTFSDNIGPQISNLGRGTVRLLGNVFNNYSTFAFNSYGGSLESLGYNVAETSPAELDAATDVVGVDPRLGPLGDYGGSVPTFSLLPDSPAIDLNDGGSAPFIDSRGVQRNLHGRPDSGAFESRGRLTVFGGQGGTTGVLSAFASPLQVRLTNDAGNADPGRTITFRILSGSATFSDGSTTANVLTQSNGVASAPTVIGGLVSGQVLVEARIGNRSVLFTLTVTPGSVVGYQLEAFIGDSIVTSVDPNQLFSLQATPVDAYGNVTTNPYASFVLCSSDPLAGLPSDPIFVSPGDGSIWINNVSLRTSGAQTLTLTEIFDNQFSQGGSSEGAFSGGGGPNTLTGSLTLIVTNQAPSNIQFEVPQSITVGQAFAITGSFEDLGDDRDHDVWIDWGDGIFSYVRVPAGERTFSTEYAYSVANSRGQGGYNITVTVYDADNASSSAARSIRVDNVPPQVNAGSDIFLNVGGRLFREILITHPSGGPYRVFVDYGDDTPEVELDPVYSESEGPPQYFLDHVYTRERSFPVSIRVVEPAGAQGFAFFIADVLLPGINPEDASKVTLSGLNDQVGTVSAPGVQGRFFRDGRLGFSGLIVAKVPTDVASSLDTFPLPPLIEERKVLTLVSSYDVRGLNIGPNDFAIVSFTYRNDDLDPPVLRYYDELLGQYVIISPASYSVNPAKRQITIRLDDDSIPRLQDLFGTVFTISVQLSVQPPSAQPIDPGGVGGAGGGGVFTTNVALVLSSVSVGTFALSETSSIASAALDNGPGRVDGKAVTASDTTLIAGIGGSSKEAPLETSDWFRMRVRGEGVLDDLPAPPADAVALPGVTLSPAEPRLLETLPALPMPPSQSPSAQESSSSVSDSAPQSPEESVPATPDSWEQQPFSPDALFGNESELTSMGACPALFVPLLGAWEPRPAGRKRPTSPSCS